MVRRAISAQRHQQKYTRRPHPRLRHPPHTRRQPFRPTVVISAHNQEMRPLPALQTSTARLRFPNWTRFNCNVSVSNRNCGGQGGHRVSVPGASPRDGDAVRQDDPGGWLIEQDDRPDLNWSAQEICDRTFCKTLKEGDMPFITSNGL